MIGELGTTLLRRLRKTIRRIDFAMRFAGRPIRVDPTAMVSRRAILRVNGGGSITVGANCEIHDFAMLNGLFFFLGKWVYELLFLIAARRLHGAEMVMQALVWSPLSAAATALAGIFLLVLLRPLLETSPA